MDIHIPVSAVLVVLALLMLALAFVGYQLDDIYRRIKDMGPVGTYDIKDIIAQVSSEVNKLLKDADVQLNTSFNRRIESKIESCMDKYYDLYFVLNGRVMDIEEQLKPKTKGKRGRPRKKVIDGHTHSDLSAS